MLVRDVEPDSPAAGAGVQRGDLIIALDAVETPSVDSLFDALEAGATAPKVLRVVRGVEQLDLAIYLGGERR